MKTKEMIREQISAFADGELADRQLDDAFAAVRQSEGRADWEIYHQIGDVLRSEDISVTLSPGFASRMAARLESEPEIIAIPDSNSTLNPLAKHSLKRWALPSVAAAAAMATVAFVTTPQLMVAMKHGPATNADAGIASAQSTVQPGATVTASVTAGMVLRDPRIDDYLLAHQRFSPSVYSTTQYVRSATFATDSSK